MTAPMRRGFRWRLYFFLFLIAISFFTLPAQDTSPPPSEKDKEYREIRGLLLGVDGKPAGNREIHFIKLSRGAWPDTEKNKDIYKTDLTGRFTIQLWNRNSWNGKAIKEDQQQSGYFELYVNPGKEEAGAVSPVIGCEYGDFHNEWGDILALPINGLDLTMRIRKGITLKGHVADYLHPEKPLPGIVVYSNNDLHQNSHSGYGGEIFQQSTTTDTKGNFVIRHIYPVQFYLGLGDLQNRHGMFGFPHNPASDNSYHWLKTKIRGVWKNEAEDVITPKSDEAEIKITILATKKSLFTYYGRIVDKQGKPFEANIMLSVASHAKKFTFIDQSSHRTANSNERGYYEVHLPTPWVYEIDVNGERKIYLEKINQKPFPPGEYNFTVKSNSANDQH